MPEPRILVTGADGQVGWELTRLLSALGYVHAVRRAECDLADAVSLRAALDRIQPSVIVNAAAYTAVDRAEQESDLAMRVNATAVGELGAWGAQHGALVVHYSTDYVFDGLATTPYTEASPTAPQSVYGGSKLEGERLLAASGAAALTIRTSWVYAMRGQNFVRTMLRLARERRELRVVADQRGSPTWARWLAASTVELLARVLAAPEGPAHALRGIGGVLHLSAAGDTTWHHFAERVLALDPKREEQVVTSIEAIPTAAYPTPARRPPYSVLDGSKAVGLGIQRPSWDEQLEAAFRSAQAQ